MNRKDNVFISSEYIDSLQVLGRTFISSTLQAVKINMKIFLSICDIVMLGYIFKRNSKLYLLKIKS